MKGSFRSLRVILTASLVLGLAACGGGDTDEVSLGGTISGLSSGTLVLSNSLNTFTAGAGTTTFEFPARLTSGTAYAVKVTTQPAGMTCTVANGTGVAGTEDIKNIAVTCGSNNNLGGTVSGLTTAGLILANGSSTVEVPANSSSFVFANKVVEGSAYGVTVLQQPTGYTCTVANSAGIMGPTDVTSVSVSCNPTVSARF